MPLLLIHEYGFQCFGAFVRNFVFSKFKKWLNLLIHHNNIIYIIFRKIDVSHA